MRSILNLAFCLITALTSSVKAQPSAIAGTYEAKARALMIEPAARIAKILSDAAILPNENFTNATVTFYGRAAQPSGVLTADVCVYEFQRGALTGIERKDLFVDKGPESLILLHLTSEQLTLTTNQAVPRAVELLQNLGFDIAALRKNYSINLKDDLMTAYPIRNGGPNFPRELHFFGELRSRHKIKITVNFLPLSISSENASSDFRLEFLATTGEFLSARFPEPASLAAHGVKAPDPVTVPNTADFSPPLYFIARASSPGADTLPPDRVAELFSAAARNLRQQIGAQPAQAYLLFDNLNASQTLAAEMHKVAGDIPWTGLSQPWMENVPFDPAKLAQLTRNRRGLALVAICGNVQIQIEPLTNFPTFPFHGNDPESIQHYFRERDAAQPAIANFMERFHIFSAPPDHLIVMIAPYPHRAFQTVISMAGRAAAPHGFVVECPGDGLENAGLEYLNGRVLTNAIVALSMTGYYPLEHDTMSLLQRKPEKRIPAASTYKPIQDIALAFGRHPLHTMVDILGPDNIRALQTAQQIEILRLNPQRATNAPPTLPNINGFEILESKMLPPQNVQQFVSAVLHFSHTNHFASEDPERMLMSRDLFHPRIAYRIPNVPLTFVCTFGLGVTQILRPDAPPASFHFSQSLGKIAAEVFPNEREIQELTKPRRQPL
jgi:hypothetical protein